MNKAPQTVIYLFFLMILMKADDCHWVSDHCPVWNGWSDPKCHVDEAVCDGSICYKYACTYCAAKAFGCFVDLQGGVDGYIMGVDPGTPYNCYGMEIRGDNHEQFYVHCGCGGACSFHGNWKITYRRWNAEEKKTASFTMIHSKCNKLSFNQYTYVKEKVKPGQKAFWSAY